MRNQRNYTLATDSSNDLHCHQGLKSSGHGATFAVTCREMYVPATKTCAASNMPRARDEAKVQYLFECSYATITCSFNERQKDQVCGCLKNDSESLIWYYKTISKIHPISEEKSHPTP